MISFEVSNVINLYLHTFVMSLRIEYYCASGVLIHKGLYQSDSLQQKLEISYFGMTSTAGITVLQTESQWPVLPVVGPKCV